MLTEILVIAVIAALVAWRLSRLPTSYPPAELRRHRARVRSSLYRRNLIALMAEERLAMSINSPTAIVQVVL